MSLTTSAAAPSLPWTPEGFRTMRRLSPTTCCVSVSSNPGNLAATKPHVTVEAEYGDALVVGSILTMAHHGPRAGQPAPCSYGNEIADLFNHLDLVEIGVSHLDLDTVGGIMAVYGCKGDEPCFWSLAEFVDLNGVHKIAVWEADAPFSTEEKGRALAMINAWFAWNARPENRVYAPSDGTVLDITAVALRAVAALVWIFVGEAEYMAAGRQFASAEKSLNSDSFVGFFEGGVVLRVANSFTNHLYVAPDGAVGKACVGYNPETGSVTVSFADGVPAGVMNARVLVQSLWGDLAGGHDGIAGSPRGEHLSAGEAYGAAQLLSAQMVKAAKAGG